MMAPVTGRLRPLFVVLAVLAVLLSIAVAGPRSALAQDIPRLEAAVTDETGLLTGDRPRIEGALEQLFARTGVQLYVLFVVTTGSLDMADYADAVGETNLGAEDALVVVAIEDRTDQLVIGSGLRSRLSQTTLDRIRTTVLEPGLASGDFGGAVIETADALGEALVPPATAPPTPVPSTPGPVATPSPGADGAGGGGGNFLLLLIGGILVVVGIAWLLSRVTRLRTERRAAFEEAKQQEQLGREANALLIKTDDALRDAEQELGYVEAEYGERQVAPMKKALAGAREELKAAFAIGQKLDDSEPETAEQRRQMIEEIIARCQKAQTVIEELRAEGDRLRDMEQNAPKILDSLVAEVAQVAALLEGVPAAQARLERYGVPSIASVKGNLEAARARIESARAGVGDGRAALEAGDRPAAAVAANAAQKDLADALALAAAVTNLADSLDVAARTLATQLAEAAKDVEAARANSKTSPAPGMAEMFTQAEAALNEARQLADAPRPDVLAASRKATEANALSDKLLAGVQAAQVAHQRTQQNAIAAIATAKADVSRASDYINGYRRSQAIGREARNRLAEAERVLAQAEQTLPGDVGSALQLARSADALANEAYRLAVEQAPQSPPFDPTQYRADDGLGSLVIGAILGGMLSGGGRSGSVGSAGASRPTRRGGGSIFGGTRSGGFGGGRSSGGSFGRGLGSGGFRGGFGGGRSSGGRW